MCRVNGHTENVFCKQQKSRQPDRNHTNIRPAMPKDGSGRKRRAARLPPITGIPKNNSKIIWQKNNKSNDQAEVNSKHRGITTSTSCGDEGIGKEAESDSEIEESTKLLHRAIIHATHQEAEQNKRARTVKGKEARKGKLVLLVDTGADFSIIKEESMKNFPNKNRIRTSVLTGAFGGRASTLGTTEIQITDKRQLSWSNPINQRQYRLPHVHKEEINRQVSELLKEGIISPSVSPWNSPILLVPKKSQDGQKTFRLVVDFRKLNEATIKQVFPIPRIDEILDQLGNSRYFTTLDLASGYHQVLVHEQDRAKTAFSTDKGHYEFNRMPFGLTGAPATFQMVMNTVLTGLQGLDCFVYLDDIVVYGRNVADHERKLSMS
ncbi:Retrovirus-related Pol polyprotein from transposon 297 [Eumeta japonica]|uniref:Retrovirus-related Pol polyprotein from transposon 297 n=1 Tax=Eumeta variegata TaxID=151549 RepID=A0A4C1SDC3_EUMVA|nr:Retrovirus-related Pol polyprotein from transposon 297 [Eumeta japonica]